MAGESDESIGDENQPVAETQAVEESPVAVEPTEEVKEEVKEKEEALPIESIESTSKDVDSLFRTLW